jgi:hypothetical protein
MITYFEGKLSNPLDMDVWIIKVNINFGISQYIKLIPNLFILSMYYYARLIASRVSKMCVIGEHYFWSDIRKMYIREQTVCTPYWLHTYSRIPCSFSVFVFTRYPPRLWNPNVKIWMWTSFHYYSTTSSLLHPHSWYTLSNSRRVLACHPCDILISLLNPVR